MRALLCVLLFVALTSESERSFAEGKFHTFMAHTEPLFLGNPVRPWDVAIAIVGLLALLRRGPGQQVGPLNTAVLTSAGALTGLWIWGLLRGGDFRMGYFQIAELLRMLLLYPVALVVFRTRRALRWLALTVAAAAAFQAVVCILAHRYFLANVGVVEWPEYMTEHHDSVLWSLVLIGLSFALLSGLRLRALAPIALLIPLLLLAVHYNDRRIAWVEIGGGLALGYLLVPNEAAGRRLKRLALAVLPLLALYAVVGWGRPGALFAPVRQIQSLLVTQGDESNTYRDLENMGLVVTLQSSRFLGTGFGHPFREVSDAYSEGMSAAWAEYRYTPHNSVLWLASVAGVAGFPLVWAFLPLSAYFAARSRAFAQVPLDRVLATAAFAYPFVYGVQAYADMGLQSFKANVLLACTLAAGSRLAVLTGAWPTRRPRRRAALTHDEPRVRMAHD